MNQPALSVYEQGFLTGTDFDFLVPGRALIDLHVNDVLELKSENGISYQFRIVRIEMRRKKADQISPLFSGDFFLKALNDFHERFSPDSNYVKLIETSSFKCCKGIC